MNDLSYDEQIDLSDEFFDTRRYQPEGVGVEYDEDGLPVVEEDESEVE